MSSLFLRNKIYYVAYFDHKGRRLRISTGTSVLSAAKDLQQRIDAQYGNRRMKLSAFIEYYRANAPAELSPLTVRKNLDALRRLRDAVGDKQLRQLSRLDFETFKRKRLTPDPSVPPCGTPSPSFKGRPARPGEFSEAGGVGVGLKPVSLNSELRALRSVFNYIVTLETILDRNPMQHVAFLPDDGEEAAHLTVADIAALIKSIGKPWLKEIITLGILTGMRPGELVALLPGQINLQAGTVTIRKTSLPSQGRDGLPAIGLAGERSYFRPKAGRVRTIPLHPSAAAIICTRMQFPPPLRRGVRGEGDTRLFPYSRSYVSHQVKKAMADAGIDPRCNFRSLRHTFATLLLQQGTPIYNVQRLLGHSSIALTEHIYSHHQAIDMASSVNTLQVPA